jgi:lipoprotein LprG
MRIRARRAALGAAALAAALTVSLAGCGGGSGSAESPAKALAAAKTTMDQATSWHMVLATDATPSGGNAVLRADGVGTHDPLAWKGSVDVVLKGLRATVPLVAVNGTVYAKLPFNPLGYVKINPTEYDAPDPAGFMDPETGISTLLTKLRGAHSTGQARAGSEVVTTYAGDLPGAEVKRIIPSADGSSTYPTTVDIDKQHRVTSVTVKGAFFGDSGDVTYTLEVNDYGQDVKITAP